MFILGTKHWRKAPKWMLVLLIFGGSTILFGFWYLFWRPRPAPVVQTVSSPAPAVQKPAAPAGPTEDEIRQRSAATLPDRMDRLFVADGDLYDAESGELVMRRWIRGDTPPDIVYDADQQRLICRGERGVARYRLDGTADGVITSRYGVLVDDESNEAVFAKNGDMWIADVDWQAFKLENERQITRLGNLQESFMMQNVILGGDEFIVLRNLNQLLRISRKTGDVSQTRLPLNDVRKGRSPDGKILMTDASDRSGRRIAAYDVDKDDAVTYSLGRAAANDLLWLTKNQCAVLYGGESVCMYDRQKNAFSAVCSVPPRTMELVGPSPDGRFVMAFSQRSAVVIDFQKKTAIPFPQYAAVFEWVSPDSLLLVADVPDSATRGTWFLKIGGESQRLTDQPALVDTQKNVARVILPVPEWFVFATRNAFFRASADGSGIKEITTLRGPIRRMQGIVSKDDQ